jgi:hypothetical protein
MLQIVEYVIIFLVDVLIIAVATYFATRYLNEKFRNEQQNKADNSLLVAKEQTRAIELEAKDKALKLMQEAEAEVAPTWRAKMTVCRNAVSNSTIAWKKTNSASKF